MNQREVDLLKNRKYFIDTEFIEGFHKPFLGKRRHFIDLISIGIVAEDGREYYAVSNEFDIRKANDWVKKNVLSEIFWDMANKYDPMQAQGMYSMLWGRQGVREFEYLLQIFGKSNKQIAEEVFFFVNNDTWIKCQGKITREEFYARGIEYGWGNDIQFYGYYADYDWVLFCSLFGTMMDLPKGFPMYCRDLKQILDEKVSVFCRYEIQDSSFESALERLKKHPDYPKQIREHNAIDDARWNKKLYDFIQKL